MLIEENLRRNNSFLECDQKDKCFFCDIPLIEIWQRITEETKGSISGPIMYECKICKQKYLTRTFLLKGKENVII